MLGYMTASAAKAEGFTHHGSYYGIPLWMSGFDGAGEPTVATKWAPMELLMSLAHHIEGFLFPIVHGPDAEPCFMFKMGGKIQ